jgi:hypothetical protein
MIYYIAIFGLFGGMKEENQNNNNQKTKINRRLKQKQKQLLITWKQRVKLQKLRSPVESFDGKNQMLKISHLA